MPARDKTGPDGRGPLTGRGFGPCNGTRRSLRRGFGRGFGRGYRCFAPACFTSEEELKILQDEEEALQEDLKAVRARIDGMRNAEA